MNSLAHINIGGVPEHFNIPWHIAIEKGLFAKNSISLKWRDYPGGTGAMTKDLREGKLDVAVLLTEGVVADIAKGNSSRIISQFVETPLIWGIHTSAKSKFQSVDDIEGKRYAISRLGSGSHIMAFVDANSRGFKINDDQLVIVGDIDGARKALKNDEADVFFWEKFMTKPLVDEGEFKSIGECPTQWPAFVIAAREEVINKYPHALQKLVEVISESSRQFMKNEKAADLVSIQFDLKPEDAKTWLEITKWASGQQLSEKEFDAVATSLLNVGIVENKPLYKQVCL